MDPQIQAALISTILTITAGIIGYAFREYRNRAKPFLAITKINGEIMKRPAEIEIPSSIVDAIKKSFYINKLDAKDSLGNIHSALQKSNEVKEKSKDFLDAIDAITSAVNANDNIALQSAIGKVLGSKLFEMWILLLLASDKIQIGKANMELPSVIPYYDSPDKDGCFWLGIPGFATSFGFKFNDVPILRQKCLPLVEQIERLDGEGLKKSFSDIRKWIDSEVSIAKDAYPILKDLLFDNAQWGFDIYMANLGHNPLLINKTADMFVEDETGAKFQEKCYLVLMSKDKDGDTMITDAVSPLVLRSQADSVFAFYTDNVQKDMKRGKALREAYITGSAKITLVFGAEKAGLIRNATIKTPKAIFKASS